MSGTILRIPNQSVNCGIVFSRNFLAVKSLLELRNDRVEHSASLQLLPHLLQLVPDEAADACLAVDVSWHRCERFGKVLLQDCVDSFGAIAKEKVS